MLTQRIDEEMAQALKAGEQDRLSVLRLMKTSFKNEQIKLGHELSDDEAMKVLVKEAKQRRDSISAYEGAGRDDLAATEKNELAIIEGYLPKQLGEAELAAMIDEAIKAAGDNPQLGQIIGAVKAKAGASADGALVAKLVRERLN